MLLILGGGGIAAAIDDAISQVAVTKRIYAAKEDCDVTSYDSVKRLFDLYRPSAVINCAGVDTMDKDYELDVEVNLVGALHIAQLCLKDKIPVVMIASVAGLYGKPNHMAYSAAKAGVISVVQSLAVSGCPAWAISPGRVDTKMRNLHYPDDTPGSRLEPYQVAELVVDALYLDRYEWGTNIVIRKEGLDTVIIHEHKGDGWKERLKVGLPKTI